MRKSIQQLESYVAPTSKGLPLHLNTNRLGTNPIAHDLPYWIEQMDLSDYPDGSASTLREELARFYDLRAGNFLVGNGTDDVYDLICKALLDPGGTLLHPSPSYSMYQYYARINSAQVHTVPLDANFNLRADTILPSHADLVVICTPNNPTGNSFDESEIESLLSSGKRVVIDEADAEFCGAHWISRINESPNLLVTRTFSIAFRLAGLRVGYVAGNASVISQIDRARLPYNLNAISQWIATFALRDPTFYEGYVLMIREQKPHWLEAFRSSKFKVWPTDANFILAQVPRKTSRDLLVGDLARAGVLVRATPELRDHIRVTIGTAEDLLVLDSAPDQVIG